MVISGKPIGRLSLYRRLLYDLIQSGVLSICSYDLAAKAGVKAAQVRRDIMNIGCSGHPNRGYDVKELIGKLGKHKIIGSVINRFDRRALGYYGYMKDRKYGHYYNIKS